MAVTITSFNPTSGPVGTAVNIYGSGYTTNNDTEVQFGGEQADEKAVITSTQIQAIVPSGAVTGPIEVTCSNGYAESSTTFTVMEN